MTGIREKFRRAASGFPALLSHSVTGIESCGLDCNYVPEETTVNVRVCGLFLIGFCWVAAVWADKPMGDISPLVGEWQYVTMSVQGKAVGAEKVAKYRLVIAADGALSIYDGEARVAAGRITRVDTGKMPKQIDCLLGGRSAFDGSFNPQYAQEGIYEVTATTLRMCRTRDASREARPTAFTSPPEKDRVLEEFKRLK